MAVGEYSRSDRVSSDDDILDDELSDDLSDNAVENSSVGVSGIAGQHHKAPCSNADINSRHKVSVNMKQPETHGPPCVEARQITSISTSPRTTGVTLGGQRIRIFNEPRGHPLPEEDNINMDSGASICSEFNAHNVIAGDLEVKAFEVGTSGHQEGTSRNIVTPSSLIPRLASPRRPPRKTKASPEPSDGCSGNNDVLLQEAEGQYESESGRVNSRDTAETSLSQPKDARPSTAAEGGGIIKSILKKPSSSSSSSPGEIPTSLKTFSDTITKPDSTVCAAEVNSASSGQQNSPLPAASSSGSGDFYLPTFQEYKQQNRKKKQVQFKVANDLTELKPVEGSRKLDVAVTISGTAITVTKALSGTEVIASAVSSVAEGKVDAEELKSRLSSVKIDKWALCDKQEAESVRQVRRNENTFVKEVENKLDLKKESTDVSSENSKAPTCDKDKLRSPVNDNVKAGDANLKDCVGCDENVRLQYFGAGDVEVVNSGIVSSGDVASRSGAERVEDADGGRNSTDNSPAVSGDDSAETTSGECLRKC
jgi:hypothetical protein